jgi:hypothetical protein
MPYEKLSLQEEEIGRAIVNASFQVHDQLGSGLGKNLRGMPDT